MSRGVGWVQKKENSSAKTKDLICQKKIIITEVKTTTPK